MRVGCGGGGHVAFQEMSTSHVSVTHSPHVTYQNSIKVHVTWRHIFLIRYCIVIIKPLVAMLNLVNSHVSISSLRVNSHITIII